MRPSTLRVMSALVVLAAGACGTGGAAPGKVTTMTPETTPPEVTTSVVPDSTPTSVPVATTGVMPLAGRIIVLDPGHNGQNFAHPDEINRLVDIGNGTKACNTTGTETATGYTEAQFTWEVALLVRQNLHALGATVVLTRPDNEGWGPCITERAATGNDAGADAVVSIHADGGPEDGRGYHVIHPAGVPGLTDDIAEPSLRLALALREAYAATGMPLADYTALDGLSERSDLGGLNLSDVPAVFLEAGNMRNADDAELLADPRFHQQIADAIADALVSFLDE